MTITEHFKIYQQVALNNKATPKEVDIAKHAFFAGCMVTFNETCAATNMSEDEEVCIKAVKGIFDEIQTTIESMIGQYRSELQKMRGQQGRNN